MKTTTKRTKSGETLVETLLAILIITLVSIAFFTSAVTAANINKKVTDADKKLEEQLITAEKGEGTREGLVTVVTDEGNFDYDVNFSGANGDLTSYRLKGT